MKVVASPTGCWNKIHVKQDSCHCKTESLCWVEITTPWVLFSLGSVLCLKITISLSFDPSAVHAKTTVTWFFSFLFKKIFTVFSPTLLIILLGGMSKRVESHPCLQFGEEGNRAVGDVWSCIGRNSQSFLYSHPEVAMQVLISAEWKVYFFS